MRLRPGHKKCSCNGGTPSESIVCYAMQSEAFGMKTDQEVVMRCRAGCDHWHLYAKEYVSLSEGNDGQGQRQAQEG